MLVKLANRLTQEFRKKVADATGAAIDGRTKQIIYPLSEQGNQHVTNVVNELRQHPQWGAATKSLSDRAASNDPLIANALKREFLLADKSMRPEINRDKVALKKVWDAREQVHQARRSMQLSIPGPKLYAR